MDIVLIVFVTVLGILCLVPYVLTIRDEIRKKSEEKFRMMGQDALMVYWKNAQEKRERLTK